MRTFSTLILLVFFSTFAKAQEEPSFSEFFAIEENKEKYETLMNMGAMQKARDQMISICKKWAVDKENLEQRCKCAKEEFAKVSDEMLFYVSILAFNRYQAKVEALKNGDKERFEELKERFGKKPLVPEGIEEKCTKI